MIRGGVVLSAEGAKCNSPAQWAGCGNLSFDRALKARNALVLEGAFLEQWRFRHPYVALSALPIVLESLPGPLARAITSRAFGARNTLSDLIDESGVYCCR